MSDNKTEKYVMEEKYKKLFWAVCLIFLAAAIAYYAIGKDDYEGGKTKLGKEILVAMDAGEGGTIYKPNWCGSNALLFKTGTGIQLIDFVSKKRMRISADRKDWPLNCTPDGKWVFYYHSASVPDPEHGNIKEVYRHEAATGASFKIAATSGTGSSFNWVSPNGKKIFLGFDYHVVLTDVPELEFVWFSNKRWLPSEHTWLKDSSGIAALMSIKDDIGVEFFGDTGWAKTFDLWKPAHGVSNIQVDKENRIYFLRSEDAVGMSDDTPYPLHGNDLLYRCNIKARELICENILVRKNLGPYAILPDGDIVFQQVYDKDKCIRRTSPSGTGSGCVIGALYNGHAYRHVFLIGVSPDGRWLAFERDTHDDSYSNYKTNLFVIELTSN